MIPIPMNESDAIASSASAAPKFASGIWRPMKATTAKKRDRRPDEAVEDGVRRHAEQVHRPRDRRHERVLDRALPALPRDRLGHELEDDPEERPDHRADEEAGREPFSARRGTMHGAGDEHDRERVRDRPEHEREVPEEVAPREVDVPLDDPAEADELVHDAAACEPASRRSPLCEHLPLSSSSVVLGVELAPGGREECLLEGLDAEAPLHVVDRLEEEQPPRSSSPTRSASASASFMSWVQSRIVASCARADLADERLHLELRARIETRGRLVEQEQHR